VALIKNSVVFPGQGSQYTGMLSEYINNEISFKNTFIKASEILNINFLDLIKKGTNKKLASTEITQPLMLVADVALWNLIFNRIDKPICLAGHSLGEYAALVASEVLSFEDSLYLVQNRARLMQEAVPEGSGGIAAIIGLSENKINSICKKINTDSDYFVSPANINTQSQIVISGTKLGVDSAIDKCKELGAKRAISLSMSIPSHCSLMRDAAQQYKLTLQKVTLNKPKIPILQNVDSSFENESEKIRNKLVQQIYKPVRWKDTINAISMLGAQRIIECGPGKVLSGLTKRILPDAIALDLDNYNNYLTLLDD
jgi:[acyl-carrier-protein] S-malonyltransferase